MLHIARDNIKTAQDKTPFYAYQYRQQRVFFPRQEVFLRVPHDSMTLSTGKYVKLAPHFCGPFIILKHIGSSAYCLNLQASIKIHLSFMLVVSKNS